MTTTVSDDYALFSGAGSRGDGTKFFALELLRPVAEDEYHNLYAKGWVGRPSLFVATAEGSGRMRVSLWAGANQPSEAIFDRVRVGTLTVDEVASSDLEALCRAVVGGVDQAWLPLLDWLLEFAPADWQSHLAAFAGRPFGGKFWGDALYG